MVGSINGFGVFVSGNIGKLMATLDPLRRRIFAVSVLSDVDISVVAIGSVVEMTYGNRACGLVISSGKNKL